VEAIPIERIETVVRSWEQPWQLAIIQPKQDCDRFAASPYDLGRPSDVAGVDFASIDGAKAIYACFFPYLYVDKIPRFAFEMGRALEAAKRLKEAEQSYMPAVRKGYPAAQSALGGLYELQNRVEDAADLYRRSADQGDPVGQTNLGTMFRDEYGGLTKNDVAAVRLYKEAAAKNYPVALSSLGWMYEQGRGGLPASELEAKRLYEQAAAKGDAYAQRALQRLGF
jgi:TPR repeat protein